MTEPTIAQIQTLAREAGEFTLRYFRKGASFSEKPEHQGIVTEADLGAEKLIKQWISSHFSGHAILAEESGLQAAGHTGPIWIVDPLDGTTNFSRGDPHYCVSIGYGLREGLDCDLRLGVVYKPATRELYWAEKGKGAWLGEQRLAVSPEATFRLGSYRTGIGPSREDALRKILDAAFRVQNECTGSAVRIGGSAALDLAYVASGFCEGFWEPDLNAWDTAAGTLMVREAGGRITNFEGREFETLRDRGVICAGPALHARLRELVAR